MSKKSLRGLIELRGEFVYFFSATCDDYTRAIFPIIFPDSEILSFESAYTYQTGKSDFIVEVDLIDQGDSIS